MNKSTLGVTVGMLAIVTFSIYWFGVQPREIRKNCWEKANEGAEHMLSTETKAELNGVSITKGDSEKFKEKLFKACLLENGLSQ